MEKPQPVLPASKQATNCAHYDRNCLLLCSVCKDFFPCRFCHDSVKCSPSVAAELRHKFDRASVAKVKCKLCKHVQGVARECESCKAVFGKYFCDKCKLFDNADKKQFHCDLCGICRQGGRENYFHCVTCGCCLSLSLKENHKCIQNMLTSGCPICLEEMMYTREDCVFLPRCSHALHKKCFMELSKFSYQCPMCFKSFVNMSHAYSQLATEIAGNPMPGEYQHRNVTILCNDCDKYVFVCGVGKLMLSFTSWEPGVLRVGLTILA
eukprot:TRINITY_DN11581_c0_g1_i1.p1 TRINITY_DN11581_c0_g1~~TRINITY_DN11581_c0_g1_i1.p1  ORF type:complete len:266 (+),score=48.91 TRINITY_DN11581_c0_g1_i1:168-965(+)